MLIPDEIDAYISGTSIGNDDSRTKENHKSSKGKTQIKEVDENISKSSNGNKGLLNKTEKGKSDLLVAKKNGENTKPIEEFVDNYNSGKALFTLNVSSILGAEYIPLITDIVRMACIHGTIQLMYYLGSSPGSNAKLISTEFVVMILYIVLGFMIFWLIFRKIVNFV